MTCVFMFLLALLFLLPPFLSFYVDSCSAIYGCFVCRCDVFGNVVRLIGVLISFLSLLFSRRLVMPTPPSHIDVRTRNTILRPFVLHLHLAIFQLVVFSSFLLLPFLIYLGHLALLL